MCYPHADLRAVTCSVPTGILNFTPWSDQGQIHGLLLMNSKQKLELTWIGKENRPKLEPRILLEEPERSYHAKHKVTDKDIFDNQLIFGDNLLALKALEKDFSGKIKCVYIDPPFNTGGAFEHYDDNLEHSIWLGLIRERLFILKQLLSSCGAIAVNLDDTEMAYCKVMMDEIFGRQNYINTVVVEAATPSSFKTVNVGPTQTTQFILLYAKDKTQFFYQQQYIPIYDIDLQHFSRFIDNYNDPAHQWRFKSINGHILTNIGFKGKTVNAKWAAVKKELGVTRAQEEVREKAVKELDGEKVVTQPISNIWTDIPTNNLKAEGGVNFPAGKKPEALVRRVIQMISDKPHDIVLDSFAGSGTTGAVAHKMGRRWIMVELGEHCHTHIIPRLKKVIDGEDPGGITKSVNWKGGGGFRYYSLAPSLLEKDKWGNWVINKTYNPAMLAEALCKLEGFTYAPSDAIYWQHGYSTEQDFIYVTTANLNHGQLQQLSDEEFSAVQKANHER